MQTPLCSPAGSTILGGGVRALVASNYHIIIIIITFAEAVYCEYHDINQ